MMWNFLIGGLLVGGTVVLYDGSPGHPDLLALWRIVDRHRVTHFGVSAAFVTACQKAGIDPAASVDLSALRTVGSTGSPLDDGGFDWLTGQVADGRFGMHRLTAPPATPPISPSLPCFHFGYCNLGCSAGG